MCRAHPQRGHPGAPDSTEPRSTLRKGNCTLYSARGSRQPSKSLSRGGGVPKRRLSRTSLPCCTVPVTVYVVSYPLSPSATPKMILILMLNVHAAARPTRRPGAKWSQRHLLRRSRSAHLSEHTPEPAGPLRLHITSRSPDRSDRPSGPGRRFISLSVAPRLSSAPLCAARLKSRPRKTCNLPSPCGYMAAGTLSHWSKPGPSRPTRRATRSSTIFISGSGLMSPLLNIVIP